MKVAIIPARGGSTRIPLKNIKPFHGKPIIAYSIETALESGLFDHVYVSTDSDEIAGVAVRYGAQPLLRAARASMDEFGTQEVMAVVLMQLHGLGIEPGFACCIYPCSPMMTTGDLRLGWRAMVGLPPTVDFAYSVGIDPFRDAGNWYWGRSEAFISGVDLDPHSPAVMKVTIPNDRVCDINTPADWARAERMYAALYPERVK